LPKNQNNGEVFLGYPLLLLMTSEPWNRSQAGLLGCQVRQLLKEGPKNWPKPRVENGKRLAGSDVQEN
jgi:hypothetical protein